MKRITTLMLVLGFIILSSVPVTAQPQDAVIYYHTDAIGSVRMITAQNGQVVARYDYLPFGEPCDVACGPVSAPDTRQFAGKERDAETGLDYFGARYYASGTGRFTTVDPVLNQERALFDPQQWNRYAYVQNNPFRYVDPDGRQAWIAWVHNALNSPPAQRAGQAVMTQAANLTMLAMRLLGSPATPELAQARRKSRLARSFPAAFQLPVRLGCCRLMWRRISPDPFIVWSHRAT